MDADADADGAYVDGIVEVPPAKKFKANDSTPKLAPRLPL